MTDADRPRQRRRRRATAPQGAPQDAGRPPAPAVASAPPQTGQRNTASGNADTRTATGKADTRTATGKADTRTAPKKTPAGRAKKPRHTAAGRPNGPDRGLHDLVGGGSSQLDASRALRARDVNRPTDADLAAAERDLQLVRRNWRPQ